MPNNPPAPVYDDETIIKLAYQDSLKKLFSVMFENSADDGGTAVAIQNASTRFANGLRLLRATRDAAVIVVNAPPALAVNFEALAQVKAPARPPR